MIKKHWFWYHQQSIFKQSIRVNMTPAYVGQDCSHQEEGSSSIFSRIEVVIDVSKIWFVAAARLDNGPGEH